MDIMSPVRKTTVGEEILKKFLDILAKGTFKPGDKLPSERKLCEMLKVSRPTLRGAIKALCLLNVLESKQGGGTYLTNSIYNIPLEPFKIRLMLEGKVLIEVLELRMIIEIEMCALAAERITDEEITNMQGKFNTYEMMVRNSHPKEDIIKASKEFHLEIARAAKNNMILSTYSHISDMLTLSRQKTIEIPGSSERAVEFHRDILKGIETKDPDLARVAMRRHLNDVRKDILSSME